MTSPENTPEAPDIPMSGPRLPSFEELSLEDQWRDLGNFLQDEEFVSGHLNDLTALAAFEVMLGTFGSEERGVGFQPVMAETWERCIDPGQPTIGLRGGTFTQQGALLAAAAQQLRSEGEAICNIVLLPEPGFADESYNESGYFTKRGVLVDATGAVYGGNFPELLRIDAISAKDQERMGDKKGAAVYLNEPGTETFFWDKVRMQERLAEADIPHTTALVTGVTADNPMLRNTLVEAMMRGESMVIKPTAESLGRGVIMIDPAMMTPQEAIDRLNAGRQADPTGQYMLERWVRSYPMTHPDTGIPLDWNLRGYLIDGQGIGEFARIGHHGSAINTSRGAIAKTLEKAFAMCGLTPEDLQLVRVRLTDLYAQIREAFPGAAIIGADIIITKELYPVLIELNGERSGGLSSMLRADYGAGFRRAHRAVRLLHDRLFPRQLPPAQTDATVRVEATPKEISDALGWIEIGSAGTKGLQLANALAVIESRSELPKSGKEFLRTLSFMSELERPTPEEIQDKLHIAVIEAKRRLMHGEAERAYEPFTQWLNVDPTDRARLQKSSTALLKLLGIKHPAKFVEQTFLLPAQSPQNAETLGRSLLLSLLLKTEAAADALSHNAVRQLSQAFAAFYVQDPADRQAPTVEQLTISAGEHGYVRLALQTLACFAAIGRGDPATLGIILQSHAQGSGRAELLIDPLEEYFTEHEPASDAERLSSFLVMVAYGKLADAYALQKQLAPEHQQWTREKLIAIFESEIVADFTEAEVPTDTVHRQSQTLLEMLLNTLEAVTAEHLDEKAAIRAINAMDQHIHGGSYPRLSDLQSMLMLHIEDRGLVTVSLPSTAPDWRHSAS
jgi:hypothetical protein